MEFFEIVIIILLVLQSLLHTFYLKDHMLGANIYIYIIMNLSFSVNSITLSHILLHLTKYFHTSHFMSLLLKMIF